MLSMGRALARAGIAPESVDHISAHGTGTPSNDRVEALAIREVFGGHAPAVTSLKGPWAIPRARPARSRRWPAYWRCATGSCRRRRT